MRDKLPTATVIH